jgi:UDP-2-acetamido-3-amino-2,3-dideoxy-glucuronate N-acetyltransferase
MFVHETATVHPSATIGRGSKIWHHAHIMAEAQLGEFVMIGHGAFVGPRVVIGRLSRIQNFANIPEGVELGDAVFVGPHVTFSNVKYPRVLRPAGGAYLRTSVGRGASLGAHSTILCGITLGEYCLVGAGAVVTRDVPPHALVYGNPAKREGWVGEAGAPLVGPDDALACPLTGDRYRVIGDEIEKIQAK